MSYYLSRCPFEEWGKSCSVTGAFESGAYNGDGSPRYESWGEGHGKGEQVGRT